MKKALCLVCLSFALCLSACGSKDDEVKETEIKIQVNDVYEQPNKPTDAQAELYNKLTKAVKKDALSESTAKLVAQNFAMDFFTIKNKTSAQDVGGLTYLPESMRENFTSYALYVYANYEKIIQEEGRKALPVVSKASVEEIEANVFTYNDYIPGDPELGTGDQYIPMECNGYLVTLSLEYEDTALSEEELKTELLVQVINLNGRLVVVQAQ